MVIKFKAGQYEHIALYMKDTVPFPNVVLFSNTGIIGISKLNVKIPHLEFVLELKKQSKYAGATDDS
jgi:hypothetical protein